MILGDVPLPAADLCHTLGLGQPLAAVVELTLDPFALADVADDRATALGTPRVVEEPRAHLHLNCHAVATDHPGDAANAPGALALFHELRPTLVAAVRQPLA